MDLIALSSPGILEEQGRQPLLRQTKTLPSRRHDLSDLLVYNAELGSSKVVSYSCLDHKGRFAARVTFPLISRTSKLRFRHPNYIRSDRIRFNPYSSFYHYSSHHVYTIPRPIRLKAQQVAIAILVASAPETPSSGRRRMARPTRLGSQVEQ